MMQIKRITEDGNGKIVLEEIIECNGELQMRRQAKAALEKTDLTALRCLKANLQFPAEWQAYVIALRAIVDSGTGPLPDQPTYPTGT